MTARTHWRKNAPAPISVAKEDQDDFRVRQTFDTHKSLSFVAAATKVGNTYAVSSPDPPLD